MLTAFITPRLTTAPQEGLRTAAGAQEGLLPLQTKDPTMRVQNSPPALRAMKLRWDRCS